MFSEPAPRSPEAALLDGPLDEGRPSCGPVATVVVGRARIKARSRLHDAAGGALPRGQTRTARATAAARRREPARYLTTNVADSEPMLPAASATRTASVCVPRGR